MLKIHGCCLFYLIPVLLHLSLVGSITPSHGADEDKEGRTNIENVVSELVLHLLRPGLHPRGDKVLLVRGDSASDTAVLRLELLPKLGQTRLNVLRERGHFAKSHNHDKGLVKRKLFGRVAKDIIKGEIIPTSQ